MELFSYIVCFIGTIINVLVLLKCYNKITKKSNNHKNIKSFLALFISSILIYAINVYVLLGYKIFFVYLILIIIFKLIYKESYYEVILKSLIIYLLMVFFDFLVSIVFMLIPAVQSLPTGSLTMIKGLCTIIVSIFLFLLFKIKIFVNLLNKLINILVEKKNIVLLFFAGFVFFSFDLIAYFHAVERTFSTYILSFLLILFFLFLCIIAMLQYFKSKHRESEQKLLLDLVNEYENILDKDRENRHEMLNNLVILKSYKNKDSNEYEEILDDIINEYQNKKSKTYANLYKFPSGIKGIVYYKLANISNNELNFNTVISPEVSDKFELLDSKSYFKINKIIGILLDNAIEASVESNDKLVLIDIYYEKDTILIYIENTFVGNINISEISKKGISSKGKNRGYGLHLVNKIIKGSNNLDFEQYIYKNKFVSILKIKL